MRLITKCTMTLKTNERKQQQPQFELYHMTKPHEGLMRMATTYHLLCGSSENETCLMLRLIQTLCEQQIHCGFPLSCVMALCLHPTH